MNPERILYVNGGIMSRGGIESYMMSYYRTINRKKLQIDFIVHGFEKGAYDDEIESLGGIIYRVPVKSKDYFGNIKSLKKIFKSHDYKLVHSHMDAMSFVVLKIAKQCGVPIRIAHSHNTQHLTNNKLKYFLNEYARKSINKYANNYFACSELAGRWLFGEEKNNNGEVQYIKNAIDMNNYIYDGQQRQNIRAQLNINDNFVIGHVGRFDYQKNHLFLLDVFFELLKEAPQAKLVLVGDGHLRKIINDKIENLKIENDVIVLGVRDDINKLLNAFDIFILPSLFEGLPVVLVEAQVNGLQCIISDTISKEVNLTNNVQFVSIKEGYEVWVNAVLNSKSSDTRKTDTTNIVTAGYSIKEEAEKLEKLYFELIGTLK